MLQMRPPIQREAAVPLSVTFDEKALLADSIFFFPPILFLPLSFIFFLPSLWVSERETCRFYFVELR